MARFLVQSISFGTAAVFNDANTGFTSTAFDTTNNKVVIAFADKGNSNRGTAIVGTVSGTDISFGSEGYFSILEQLLKYITLYHLIL